MKRLVRLLAFGMAVSFVLFTAVGASGSGSKSAAAIPAFTPAQLSAPAGADWLSDNGNVQAWRYTTLSQINGSNGGSLKLAWSSNFPPPAQAEKLVASNAHPIA